MPAFPQIVGPSYQLASAQAAIERMVNWFLVPNEAADSEGKFKMLALPLPGNAPFSLYASAGPEYHTPCRGLLENRGKVFGVNGSTVYELKPDGTYVYLGTCANDGLPCVMYANGNDQVFVGTGTGGTGEGYVIPAGAAVGSLISLQGNADYLGCVSGSFQDGYALNVIPDSNAFQWGGDDDHVLGQMEYWNAANKAILAGQADKLRALKSWREYIYLMGARRSQIYQNVGSNGIGGDPFASYNSTFIETGIAAPAAFITLDDSLIWIGEDARGQRACWRSAAFQPQRISNFGVERWWQSYTQIDDAIGFAYIWQGHQFIQFNFPHAGLTASNDVISATWLYDATASALLGKPIWTERSYMAPGGGLQDAVSIAPGRAEVSHAFCFGKHLVGSNGIDGNPGAIYQMAEGVYIDCGADPITGDQILQPIVCDRITPHGPTWGKRSIHNRIEFELQRGVGAQTAAVTFTGDLTNTSDTIVVADTTGLYVNQLVTGSANIPNDSFITAIVANTTVTISNAATGTEVGATLQACLAAGINPQLLLRWSNDGGMTFGTEYPIPIGQQGQYNVWVYLLQLGYANHPGRVYWVRCADPVMNTLMNCTLDYFDLAT